VESVATWLNNVFPFMIGVHFGRPINVDVVIAVMGGLDDRVCLLIESRLRDEPASCIFESSEGLDSPRCFLGDSHRIRILPQGNYPILQALFVAFCSRVPRLADRWLSVVEHHLERRRESQEVWAALLFHELFLAETGGQISGTIIYREAL